jgi:homoserine kinase type II
MSPGVIGRYAEADQFLKDGFARLCRSLEGRPRDRAYDLTARWLALAPDVAVRVRSNLRATSGFIARLQPCLRDARPEHFLFRGDRVSGLVDFGAMDVETVAADIARLLSEWLAHDDPIRDEAIRAYEEVRPLDPAELRLVMVFEMSADLLIGAHWARWHYLEGRRFDDPSAVVRGLEKGVARVERLARACG